MMTIISPIALCLLSYIHNNLVTSPPQIMSKNVQHKEKIFISGLLFDKYFERFPRSFQGRATHSHRRLIGNYKNLWHMGHLLIMWSHYWSLSACPRAKISVEDFGNFQWVHFPLQGGVTPALKLDPWWEGKRACAYEQVGMLCAPRGLQIKTHCRQLNSFSLSHLYCLSVVDINLADLSYDEVSRLGLNIVYLVLVSVVKVHFDLIDLVVPGVGALKVLVSSLVALVIPPRLHLVILAGVDFMVLAWNKRVIVIVALK